MIDLVGPLITGVVGTSISFALAYLMLKNWKPDAAKLGALAWVLGVAAGRVGERSDVPNVENAAYILGTVLASFVAWKYWFNAPDASKADD